MPNCPHCGEPYRYGQDKCYACGEPVKARGAGGKQINPLVFIIAGGIVVIAVLGIVLVTANRAREARETRDRLEQERIADSVRQANLEQRIERRRTRREDTEAGVLADLELRLERVAARAERGRLSPEKAGLVSEADVRIARLRQLLESMADRDDRDQAAISDTILTEAEETRELLTRIGRAR